jgi:hypothetical protein
VAYRFQNGRRKVISQEYFFTRNICGKKKVKVKVNQSRYRPGVAQRVPGS